MHKWNQNNNNKKVSKKSNSNSTTNEQLVDILTKGLLKPTFDYLTSKLELIDIYEPTWGGVLRIALF